MSDSTDEIPAEQIGEWLEKLIDDNSTTETRILSEGKPPIVRHYPSNAVSQMARDAQRLGKGAKGIYFLLNPLPPNWNGGPAKDSDIARRRWLLIDCDPKRTGTVSSTDAEKALAEEKAFDVATFLESQGWPEPVIADSGNGFHLLYRIALPADDGGLVARVLKVVAARFSDDQVDIDIKVGNASRICKLYGTLAAKGEDSPERPHRLSKVISVPDPIEIVPVELLRKLAREDEPPSALAVLLPHRPDSGGRKSHAVAVEQARKYLRTMAPSVSGEHGHDKLLKAASVLVNDFSLTDAEAFDLLVSEFNPRCSPPWDESELWRKIGEAKKKPPHRDPKGRGSHRKRAPDDTDQSEAIVVRLSDVIEEEVEWLWPNRIPIGKLTLLAGDPGLGKSFVTVNMAARVSTGTSWPDCPGIPQPVGSVVMFNCEDDVADTILPRLNRAAGNPAKVIALQGVNTVDSQGRRQTRGFTLDRDLPSLKNVLEANPDVRLVVIDPISAYCGGTDSHKNADVRGMLAPLADLARQHRVAVVMVTHLAKGTSGKSVYRAMGSLAFTAAARAVWHVAKDHNDDSRRLILMSKMNVCQETTGLAYRLEDGKVCWEEAPVEMTADEHLATEDQAERKSTFDGQAVVDAAEWLAEMLSDRSMLASHIHDLAEEAETSKTTLKRAKKRAGVVSERQGFGRGSVVWWTLRPMNLHEVLSEDDIDKLAELCP
jgi:putative DNA primase/helicase